MSSEKVAAVGGAGKCYMELIYWVPNVFYYISDLNLAVLFSRGKKKTTTHDSKLPSQLFSHTTTSWSS